MHSNQTESEPRSSPLRAANSRPAKPADTAAKTENAQSMTDSTTSSTKFARHPVLSWHRRSTSAPHAAISCPQSRESRWSPTAATDSFPRWSAVRLLSADAAVRLRHFRNSLCSTSSTIWSLSARITGISPSAETKARSRTMPRE